MKIKRLVKLLNAIEKRYGNCDVAVCTDEIRDFGKPGYNHFSVSKPADDDTVIFYPGKNFKKEGF